MAQDLGLFRDVEKWFLPVQRFSHEEKQTRKRVWWGCIILDRYTASYIGRPGTSTLTLLTYLTNLVADLQERSTSATTTPLSLRRMSPTSTSNGARFGRTERTGASLPSRAMLRKIEPYSVTLRRRRTRSPASTPLEPSPWLSTE